MSVPATRLWQNGTNFDAAIEGQNYEMTKLVPNNAGHLVEYCVWYLNDTGEILWYFDDDSELGFGGAQTPIFLPVPFRPGDIVAADCRPYAALRPVLILDIGDNLDCCCVSCLSIGKDGCLDVSAFKHRFRKSRCLNRWIGHNLADRQLK